MPGTATQQILDTRAADLLALGRHVNHPVSARTARRWGIILAGGDGQRLLPMTRVVSGDDRPKQFCPLIESCTLVEQTRRRAERSIAPEQILFALTRKHEAFYLREAGIRPSQRIVQPVNRGTAPPIVYSLLSIQRQDSEAIVAVLPSDHHYTDEPAFVAALESAFNDVAKHRGSVILLGSPARGAQTEYGWIELGQRVGGATDVSFDASFQVERFCEKPTPEAAKRLFGQGALWNTFVMVGHVHDFLEMVAAARTGLLKAFPHDRLWSRSEIQIEDWIYDRIYAVDFSREILSTQPNRLIARRLEDTGWNDLGHPERVIDALETAGLRPWWMKEWRMLRRPPAAAGAIAEAAVA